MDTYDHDDAVYHLPRPVGVIIAEAVTVIAVIGAIVWAVLL